jgi:hypothetical protein
MVDESEPEAPPPPIAVRAQLLATEHWSLLATRNTAQSEVLSRITTFLMLVSSSIIGLALIGQVTRFDGHFIAFALSLLGMLVVIGTLTQMRLGIAAIEDLALMIGMNRLRAAYAEIDPGIERYFVTSAHDDDIGVWQSYNPLARPRPALQPLASSGAFITFLNSGLFGALTALVAVALHAPGWLVAVVGASCAIVFLAVSVMLGLRQYQRLHRGVLFPQPKE